MASIGYEKRETEAPEEPRMNQLSRKWMRLQGQRTESITRENYSKRHAEQEHSFCRGAALRRSRHPDRAPRGSVEGVQRKIAGTHRAASSKHRVGECRTDGRPRS